MEFLKLYQSLIKNKATGINSIRLKILKLAKQPNSNFVSKVFNLFFSSGIFPKRLKTVRATLILKKGSKLERSNYRLILSLSIIDKFIEKLIHKRVM